MRILITGATGRVGSEAVRRALRRNWKVLALSRSADKLDIQDPNLRKVAVDILQRQSVVPLLEGVDTVIHAVGIGASKVPTTIYSDGARRANSCPRKGTYSRFMIRQLKAARDNEVLKYIT